MLKVTRAYLKYSLSTLSLLAFLVRDIGAGGGTT